MNFSNLLQINKGFNFFSNKKKLKKLWLSFMSNTLIGFLLKVRKLIEGRIVQTHLSFSPIILLLSPPPSSHVILRDKGKFQDKEGINVYSLSSAWFICRTQHRRHLSSSRDCRCNFKWPSICRVACWLLSSHCTLVHTSSLRQFKHYLRDKFTEFSGLKKLLFIFNSM